MYNPWKPQETLLYTLVLKPVLQATATLLHALHMPLVQGTPHLYCPQYSTAYLVCAYFRRYSTTFIPLFLVQSDTWYNWYKPQTAPVLLFIEYYRLLVLHFIFFLTVTDL